MSSLHYPLRRSHLPLLLMVSLYSLRLFFWTSHLISISLGFPTSIPRPAQGLCYMAYLTPTMFGGRPLTVFLAGEEPHSAADSVQTGSCCTEYSQVFRVRREPSFLRLDPGSRPDGDSPTSNFIEALHIRKSLWCIRPSYSQPLPRARPEHIPRTQ